MLVHSSRPSSIGGQKKNPLTLQNLLTTLHLESKFLLALNTFQKPRSYLTVNTNSSLVYVASLDGKVQIEILGFQRPVILLRRYSTLAGYAGENVCMTQRAPSNTGRVR